GLATVLSAAVVVRWLLPPDAVIADTRQLLTLVLFLAIGLVVSRLNHSLREAEAAQRAAAERIASQLESLRSGELAQQQLAAIVGKDLNGTITSWNQGAERLFGYASDEIVRRSIGTIVPPGREGEEDEMIGRIRAGRHVQHFETVRMRKDGSLIDVSLTVSPI